MHVGSAMNANRFLKEPSNDCFVYRKVNGTVRDWYHSECVIGNTCCFSAITLDLSGHFSYEAGGCQDDFLSFIRQNSGIEAHPLDYVPFIGAFSEERIQEYCEFEMCLASTSPNSHWRICACHEDQCNRGGVNDMLRKFMLKKPHETSTLSFQLFDKTLEILLDG
ncbi:unnamed protein product [Thelazia callipaeda]|uniref:ZP domain-containing protein n=1 Tax=Thelazia callipaeda TaxID=103827 RepID=A0A0N5D9K0_THECL|nr:unnamed protein product [Thelazia callipaeda]